MSATAGFSARDSCLRVDGKFLQADGARFFLKGVSYGTFAPGPDGRHFPHSEIVEADFAAMARAGVNTVRVYTPPSAGLLDLAAAAGLRLMIGLPWAQHVAFLADRQMRSDIRREIRASVREMAGHPAAGLFAVGNEIPPEVVRWHGRRHIERFLRELYDAAKQEAPGALITYVNYPTTEYLDTSAFDVCAFNIYLHDRSAFAAYLARVQHIAGNKPLLISELGGDSQRLSDVGQAELVGMQLRTAYNEGACGAVVFSWTDEWWRGGQQVRDWKFGLVDEQRAPKPALRAASRVFRGAPFREERLQWPKVSVVVCGYNAADTIDECLTSIERLRYPNYEIIFVNDGSKDATGAIALQHRGVSVIESPNAGLAAARNLGLAEASGEIIAYTDADVRVDPDWLTYLVQPLVTTDVVGAGGPNVVPEDDSWIAQCVARAPGSPMHVLLDDVTAEHVPGCNMAFWREALLAIGGFDPTFIKAGDDVDLCWRLQARGWRIGFAPAALVWHRHRGSVRAYYRQQVGYGEGETWLTYRHPSKFFRGRILWAGHIYSPLPMVRSFWESQIHTGPLGRKAFPSVYRMSAAPWSYLPHSGRWMIAALVLLGVGGLATALDVPGSGWSAAAGGVAALVTIARCVVHSLRSDIARLPRVGRSGHGSAVRYRAMIVLLHVVQPLARVHGRLRGYIYGPPGPRPSVRPVEPRRDDAPVASVDTWRWFAGRSIEQQFWGRGWLDPHEFCQKLVRHLRAQRFVRSITVDDGWREDWDLNLESGWALRVTARILVEDHGHKGSVCRVAVSARPRGRCAAAAGVALALAAQIPVLLTAPAVAVGLSLFALGAAVTFSRSWTVFRRACLATAAELDLLALSAPVPEPREQAMPAPAASQPIAVVQVPILHHVTIPAHARRPATAMLAALDLDLDRIAGSEHPMRRPGIPS